MFHRSGRSLQLVKFSENSNIGLCFKSLLDWRIDFFLKVRFVYKLKSQRLILTVVAHQSFHNASGEVKRSFLRWRIAVNAQFEEKVFLNQQSCLKAYFYIIHTFSSYFPQVRGVFQVISANALKSTTLAEQVLGMSAENDKKLKNCRFHTLVLKRNWGCGEILLEQCFAP